MIAITGASGLVGRYLVQALAEGGQPVVALSRKPPATRAIEWREADICDIPSLREALRGAHTVIHAAAEVSFNPHRKDELMATNVGGTRAVVDTCLALGIPKLIHISSVAALGRSPGGIITEDTAFVDNQWVSDYARSKHMAELEVFRGQEEGLWVALVNPSLVLAPVRGQSSARLLDYVWNENRLYPLGSINCVDARDVAGLALRLLGFSASGHRFIANAGALSYREFFEAIAHRWNKRPPHLPLPRWLANLAGRIEEWRGWILQQEPVYSRQSARIAQESFQYENQKAVRELGMQFRSISETLDWCCAAYPANITTNK